MKTSREILNKISKEYKQEDFAYSLKNCLPSVVVEIVHESMKQQASSIREPLEKEIGELCSKVAMLSDDNKAKNVIVNTLCKDISEKDKQIQELQDLHDEMIKTLKEAQKHHLGGHSEIGFLIKQTIELSVKKNN